MKMTVVQYNGIEHHIACESFEFRSNLIDNWIRIKYHDGIKEMIYGIATIKAESEDKE